MQLKAASFFHKVFSIIRLYFQDQNQWLSSIILFSLLLIQAFLITLSIRLNYLFGFLFNTLKQLDQALFITLLKRYALYLSSYVGLQFLSKAIQQFYMLRSRSWLTHHYLSIWSSNFVHFLYGKASHTIDNPDQRIAQDIKFFTEAILKNFLLVVEAISTIFAFSHVLWYLSPIFNYSCMGYEFSIPGCIFWFAFLYSVLGNGITILLNRSLKEAHAQEEKVEADFRYQLMQLRNSAADFVLDNTLPVKKERTVKSFKEVMKNQVSLVKAFLRVDLFSLCFNRLTILLPYLLLAPLYFLQKITLGNLMQSRDAFRKVENAFAWILQNNTFNEIATLKAVVDRLYFFKEYIKRDTEDKISGKKITHQISGDGIILLEDVSVYSPEMIPLLAHQTLELSPGVYWVKGSVGVGKTTLFKTLLGYWPFAEGSIQMPSKDILYVSGESTLLEEKLSVLCMKEGKKNLKKLQGLFRTFQLEHLIKDLDKVKCWNDILSSGEKQKIHLIRVIMYEPTVLLMDEAMHHLDQETKKIVYDSFKRFSIKFILLADHELEKDELEWKAHTVYFRNQELIIEE